jgi:hypothetical protein
MKRWLVVGGLALAAGISSDAARASFDWRWGVDLRGNARDSDFFRFASPFPFLPGQIPPGQRQVFEQTVDPGSHTEFSLASLFLEATWSERATVKLKLDAVDLYDRNPTSTDREFDVDEAWFRFGRETAPGFVPEAPTGYLKLGKFAKFERQEDRHLESYGLAATAFNRFEDAGLETGFDLGRRVYVKASYTSGNPVFLRDPNALAGDNGTDRLNRPNPVTEYGSGIDIVYDSEVDEIDFDEAELGVGLGARFGDETGHRNAEVLLWGYQRKLADRKSLHGTFYGGDLDLLDGPAPGFGLPIRDDDKREFGANVWLYWGGLTVFGQFVDQELAGMKRVGYDAELAYAFELPLFWAIGGTQILPRVQPAVRVSFLDPDFNGGSPQFPAPSVRWQWDKLDYGLRVTLIEGLDLTFEQNDNEFILGNGSHQRQDERLITLRYKFSR